MKGKKQDEKKKRALALLRTLKKLFPDEGQTMLNYTNDFELLVAVILSAQCTDKKVNEVTEKLFKKYKSIEDYAKAPLSALELAVHQTGFYRSKAKNIKGAAQMLLSEYGGILPKSIEELVRLPGVGRKTANVVLGNAYGIVEGIAVDTHVHRFVKRFDLSHYDTPEKIEQDLMELIPKKDWFRFTYLVIRYGREIAPARVYDTSKDPLIAIYPPAGKRFRK